MSSESLIAAAQVELSKRDMEARFDAYRPGSRPTSFQQEIIDDFQKVQYQYVVAGNRSGKSQLGAFITFKVLSGQWPRPERWGAAPVQLMMLARTMKIAEESLLPKLLGFMKEDEYRIVRAGNVPQKLIHRATGNTLIFQSHHNVNEARQKIQSFELCGLWLDEEPGDIKLIEEAQRRLQDRKGFFIATFTAKSKNVPLQKLVDGSDGILAKRYRLKMLDNPIYTDEDKKDILKSIEHLPESQRMCILEGEWLSEESAVYQLNSSLVCRNLPASYSMGWVHVEGADPALQSKHGLILFTQDPDTALWYVIRAEYLTGIAAPEDLVRAVTNRLSPYNIVRRVVDSASTWYTGQAHKMGYTYTTPYDKNNRKEEMMKKAQQKLGHSVFITEGALDLLSEMQEMQWNEGERAHIINDRKYHLHYAFIYALDRLPKERIAPQPKTWDLMVHERMNAPAPKAKRGSSAMMRVVRYAKWK